MTFNNQTVSIIIRTTQEKRIPLLKNAIASIIANDYRPLEIIVVAQSEQNIFIEKINLICEEFRENQVDIYVVVNPTSQDERTKNLNLGIKKSTGRYLGFLDDDDIIYPNHLSLLTNALHNYHNSWSYSDTALLICGLINSEKIEVISRELPFKKEDFSLQSLFKDNFIPIHSYLLDRKKIDQKLLEFDESFCVMEDYAFLLKIASQYPPQYIPIVSCEYRFFTDASNSNYYVNQLLGINYSHKAKVWQETSLKIEQLKHQLIPEYLPQDQSANLRKFFLSRFAVIYKVKYKFPQVWQFLLKIALKLRIIN